MNRVRDVFGQWRERAGVRSTGRPPSHDEPDQTRRGILGGSVAAGAMLAAPAAVVVSATDQTSDSRKKLTYRETAHVREAYRRMRF